MTKSIDFNENTNTNNNNNLMTNSSEKNKKIFFKINYNFDRNLYYLIDMRVGYGTFYKIEERTIISENSIINIGESYLVFSFLLLKILFCFIVPFTSYFIKVHA